MTTAMKLLDLHEAIDQIRDEIALLDVDRTLPKRLHAEADYQTLTDASTVLNRLYLWHKYPGISPESYFTDKAAG